MDFFVIGGRMSGKTFRVSTVKLLQRMISPLMEIGVVSRDEFNALFTYLSAIAKTGTEPTEVKPKLLTPQEAAEMLAISYSQFRALEKEGAFPFRRRMIGGKTVRYLNTDLIDYLVVGSIAKTSDAVNEKT